MDLEIAQPRDDFHQEAAILCDAILREIEEEEAATPTVTRLTDAEATDLVRRVSELMRLGSLLTRWDIAIAALAGPGSSMAGQKAADIAARAKKLHRFATVRTRLSDDRFPLRLRWDQRLDDLLAQSIEQMEEVVSWIQAGKFRKITHSECVTECVRVLPAIFNTLEETSQGVVDFCAKHALGEELLTMGILAKDVFPQASHLRTEVVDDPEGEGSWITLVVRVPKADVHNRYRDFVTRMVKEIPNPARGLLRFRPDLAA